MAGLLHALASRSSPLVDLFTTLGQSSPELVWGLLSRGLGLVFLVSFASLSVQVIPIAGARGVTPIAESLRAMARDFPTWKRFAYAPTLLWLNASDTMLLALPCVGMLAGLSLVIGGPHAPFAFALCYLAYLSLDRAIVLVYPWDCLLFEAGLWGMLLPATHVLPNLDALHAPLPAVAWVYRLLVFRLMAGFGKQKFLGKTSRDNAFLQGFFINQPLPTPLGWYAHYLPLWLHKLSLVMMFVIEVLLPGVAFVPGPWSAFGAVATASLMVAIAIAGNFGYFNLLTIVVALSWLDTRTALALHASLSLPADNATLLINLAFVLHASASLVSFPLNTFSAHSWLLWPIWARVRPRFLSYPITMLRALHPLRWVHAYGVFPPQAPPSIKLVPVIEVSWDELSWQPLIHRYSPSTEDSRPEFCAPHQERFDQAVVYEALGLNEASVFRNLVGRFDPYGYGGNTGPRAYVRRVLDGDLPGARFHDRSIDKPHGPPRAARARTYMLEPTSLVEKHATGRYWKRSLVGPHFATVRSSDPHEPCLPHPELWHFDDGVWLARSRFGAALAAATHAGDLHALVLAHGADAAPDAFGAADVQRFWAELIPALGEDLYSDWRELRSVVDRLRAQHDRATLARFERIAARYAALLHAKLEPTWLADGLAPVFTQREPAFGAKTSFHLRLLCQHIVTEGRAAYDAVVADPVLAGEHQKRMSMASGNFLQAVFRYERFVFQAQKLRLLATQTERVGLPEKPANVRALEEKLLGLARRSFGVVEQMEFLKTQLTAPHDVLDTPERWPRFTVSEAGVVSRVPDDESFPTPSAPTS